MAWVIGCTVFIYVLANLPLIYSLLFVQGRTGIARLWGYAPNQFLFLVLPFPFAILCTLVAMHLIITRVNPDLLPRIFGKWLFDHPALFTPNEIQGR